jgi:ADP-heptose:LPS heptosyltransferase
MYPGVQPAHRLFMSTLYNILSRLLPTRQPPNTPSRIVLILPCCIGDVVLATAMLKALRRAYPGAHISWAVGSWSKGVVKRHDLLDAVLDTGEAALPVKAPGGLLRFAWQLRTGKFDLAVSLVRSPLMSLAVLLSGIPYRAGLDSGGRGFGYNIRASINPAQARHEAEIYLDVGRALGIDTADCWANVPVYPAERDTIQRFLTEKGIHEPFIIANPAGGRNPGMVMDAKRWPPENFAALVERLSVLLKAQVILLGGPNDGIIVESVGSKMKMPPPAFVGGLTFEQIAALATLSALYIGNDTGLTHLAAAAGARTVMILGPSDPARYAPYAPNAIALWKPTRVQSGGVTAGTPEGWDWARDGIDVAEAETKILRFLGND